MELAITLMVVGMTTVFLILLLVFYGAKGLIAVVNRYFPESEVVSSQREFASSPSTLDQKKVAVIASVVSHVTGGRGRITSIEKQ